MATTPVSTPSNPAKITATGTRGYLLWLATDPAFARIYNAALPKIKALKTQLNAQQATGKNPAGMSGLGRIGELGDDSDLSDPPSIDISDALTDTSGTDYTAGFNVVASPPVSSGPNINSPTISIPTIPTIQVDPSTAQAASTSATSPSLAQTLSSIVGVAATGVLTADQISTANQINQIQLQRAQAGLAPLAVGTGAMGLPTAAVSLASVTQSIWPLLLIGGVALIALSGSKSRA